MKTHTVASCPGCGNESATTVELGPDHSLQQCTACRLVYAAEYADPDDIYVSGYLKGETEFGLDIFDPIFQEFLDFAAGKRLEVIESLRPTVGSLLDVGCGSGEVLRAAESHGWQVAGAEPVEESAAIARDRGLDVRTALLQDSGLPERQWDVVTAFHVLEHVPDGVSFLELLGRWAKPGGLVVIEVPNWTSVDRERRGQAWPGLRPLEHIAHYDTETLTTTFRNAGLEPVQVRSMGFLWDRQTLGEQLSSLASRRWRHLLRPVSHHVDRNGQQVVVPRPAAHKALLAAQASYDRKNKGQVVFGAARVPS